MGNDTRRLTVEWDDPFVPLATGKELSGLEYMQRLIAGEFPAPPISKLLGFRLASVTPGEAAFECLPGEQHYNPIGVVHGGLAMTLLDSAMGCAVHTLLPKGAGYTTLEVKVNLVRGITHNTGLLRALGKVIHQGRSTATAEGRLEDATGTLYAHGTTTCIILGGR